MASRSFRAVLVLAVLGLSAARGADDRSTPSLEHDVLPLLKARCVKCHGPAKRAGKLNLATPRGLARGGKHGPVVVVGQLEASLLWERVEFEEMPPDEPLEPDEASLLRHWIEQGAPGLPEITASDSEKADHWAFAPLLRPDLPALRDPEPARTPIDRFLLARLEAEGLGFAPEAERAALLRRVSFDLTGLPPTPEAIRRFLDDRDPDAYERMVDRYLASPHYGERWGKFWLDAAGYADSNGYFNADTDRPLAYRYRDYVVRAFNEDRPFDQFIREQIAGDELAAFQPGTAAIPETVDRLIATHYLRNAPDGTGESDGNPDEIRADKYAVLEGVTQVLGASLFGLTFQCARCHDHKFEPITQKDYYALYAILQPAFDIDHWVKPQERIVQAPLPEELAAWEAEGERLAAESTEDAGKARESHRERRPGRIAWVSDVSPNVTTHLLTRGLYNVPGEAVEPAPPAILCDPDNPFEVRPPLEGGPFSGRRLAFARWLTRPGSRASALLARVTVNRLWQDHFGKGLTPTSENLGYSGIPPTHPELLEFLASELIRNHWRLKPIHRLILTSTAYRQSSAPRPEAAEKDPDARAFSRFPIRRLNAEAIRDAMLAASGELDRTIGGPYVPSHREDSGEIVVNEQTKGAHRRSLYLQQRRTQVVSLLDVFDAPTIVTSCTRRTPTTVPTQALSLLNSRFVVARARALADRLRREAGDVPKARVERAFLLTLGRSPDAVEREAVSTFLETQPSHYGDQADANEHVWADFCQMLLSSNAFLYVE